MPFKSGWGALGGESPSVGGPQAVLPPSCSICHQMLSDWTVQGVEEGGGDREG